MSLQLFADDAAPEPPEETPGSPRPLSVLIGTDREALGLLLRVHAPKATRILDCTHNAGVMWKGSAARPLRSDLDPTHPLDLAADFKALPFQTGSFEVVVFDPPHLPNAAGSIGSSGIERRQYGLTGDDPLRAADHVGGLFPPFLAEARRVLEPGGIVLAKLADITHNHRYQWQHEMFLQAARAAEMTPCDLLVKCDPLGGNLKSSKWKQIHHLRKGHCFWIVVRNGLRCE